MTSENKGIVLFDGVCNFCHTTVNTIIRFDKRGFFQFAPIQSAVGQNLLNTYNVNSKEVDSVIFVYNNKAYVYSSAILHIARYMGGLFPLLYPFILVPTFIRNPLYKWIATNRYKWFGKKDQCMVPTPEIRSRFIG